MQYRSLGRSGLKVPELCFGTGTFSSGANEFFQAWGTTQDDAARKLIDLCMEAGCNFFDTADVYSDGESEVILGKAIAHLKREDVLLSTKSTFRSMPGPNGVGSSRYHITQSIEGSLKRLGTDYIDVYHMHAFDATTPADETLNTLDKLVREGKVRYIAASNFSGWHLMKSLSTSERYGWAKYVGHQVYYSLIGRDYEWELMPLAEDQGVGALVWSPLGWGRLGGKIRRGQPLPKDSRLQSKMVTDAGPLPDDEYVYGVVDALDALAAETGKSVAQLALAWVLARPTVSTVIIGARDEKQLRANLAAAEIKLTPEQIAKLDGASQSKLAYPYWHQVQFEERNPFPVKQTHG